MMIQKRACRNCHKMLWRSNKLLGKWQHVWGVGNCNNPEPYQDPIWECECWTIHGHCYDPKCKCEGHNYEIR